MTIVLISRGSLAGATAVAEAVADRLGVPCLSREFVVEAAHRAGAAPAEILDALRAPGFFDGFTRERDIYLAEVRATLLEHAGTTGMVAHGHGVHLLLGELPGALRARVTASDAFRVAALCESRGMSQRAALRELRRIDKDRQRWGRSLYGREYDETKHFDLILHLDRGGVPDAVQAVCAMASREPYAGSEQRRTAVTVAARAARVKAALARSHHLFVGDIDVIAARGAVLITGWARSGIARDELERAARELDFPGELRFEVQLRSERL